MKTKNQPTNKETFYIKDFAQLMYKQLLYK